MMRAPVPPTPPRLAEARGEPRPVVGHLKPQRPALGREADRDPSAALAEGVLEAVGRELVDEEAHGDRQVRVDVVLLHPHLERDAPPPGLVEGADVGHELLQEGPQRHPLADVARVEALVDEPQRLDALAWPILPSCATVSGWRAWRDCSRTSPVTVARLFLMRCWSSRSNASSPTRAALRASALSRDRGAEEVGVDAQERDLVVGERPALPAADLEDAVARALRPSGSGIGTLVGERTPSRLIAAESSKRGSRGASSEIVGSPVASAWPTEEPAPAGIQRSSSAGSKPTAMRK